MPTAYSYIRFSTPEQAKGDSLRRQEQARDAFVKEHGLTLDTSLSLVDAGVSSFRGAHRSDKHALGQFLALVEAGRVAKGSYLLIENLDRLSREETEEGLYLLLGLIRAGVRVVQLTPVPCEFSKGSDPVKLMMAVMELSRGHAESRLKSERVGKAWAQKRERAAAGEVLTKACPAWMKVQGGKYVLIPERAAVVHRVYSMALGGYGVRAILKTFNAEGVPSFTRKPWNLSYLKVMLKSRAAIGEFTPRTGRGSSQNRKAAAPPIPNYYPAAITPDLFHAVQAAVGSRRETKAGEGGGPHSRAGGRPSSLRVNVFAGLLNDARTGSRLHLIQYRRKGLAYLSLAPVAAIEQRGEHVSFPLAVLEEATLDYIDGINPGDVLPADSGPAASLSLAGRLADVEGRLASLKAQVKAGGNLRTLAEVIREDEEEEARLRAELDAARQKEAAPLTAAWEEARSVRKTLRASPDQAAARARLRAALRRVVSEVWCLFRPGRGDRVAVVQVHFVGGSRRDFLILHRPEHVTRSGKRRPPKYLTVTDRIPDGFDLRVRKHADELDRVLEGIDVKAVESVGWETVETAERLTARE